MRLYDFIERNMEQILKAWEDFARSVEILAPTMDTKGLRNHAQYILRTVAADMRTVQTERQQIAKAHGHGPRNDEDTPAQTHAITRLVAGFSMDQVVSEYRALRSSVLRLWLNHESADEEHHVQDMIRFNEAIDQALSESVTTYGEAVESTRKTVLGVLGHDLRSPLGAVLMAGELLRTNQDLPERQRKLAAQICTSAQRANQMVNDLLDLTRCNLGPGIPVHLQDTHLNAICRSVVEELRTGHPSANILLNEAATLTGRYDPARMAQVFSNLIGNAIQHGDLDRPIQVTLSGNGDAACFSVQNWGEPIPPRAMANLFNPQLHDASHDAANKPHRTGLGLGLFIAAQIVASHGGRIKVESTREQGTVFRVLLGTDCPIDHRSTA